MSKKDDPGPAPQGRAKRRAEPDLDIVAAHALGVIGADAGRLQRFFALTGLDAATLRGATAEPRFALALLSYVCADEALLVDVAQAAERDPDAIARLVRARAERETASDGETWTDRETWPERETWTEP